MPLCCEAGLKTGGAIAVIARPRFGAIQIAAPASRVRVLNFQKLEVLLPVWALFRQRRPAVTNLNPLYAPILELASLAHISKVFVAGDRSSPQRPILDRTFKRLRLSGLHFCGNEISHGDDCSAENEKGLLFSGLVIADRLVS
jgi:hypothetical protein